MCVKREIRCHSISLLWGTQIHVKNMNYGKETKESLLCFQFLVHLKELLAASTFSDVNMSVLLNGTAGKQTEALLGATWSPSWCTWVTGVPILHVLSGTLQSCIQWQCIYPRGSSERLQLQCLICFYSLNRIYGLILVSLTIHLYRFSKSDLLSGCESQCQYSINLCQLC